MTRRRHLGRQRTIVAAQRPDPAFGQIGEQVPLVVRSPVYKPLIYPEQQLRWNAAPLIQRYQSGDSAHDSTLGFCGASPLSP
jgi:hypothetical protein